MNGQRAKAKCVSTETPALLVPRFVLSFNEMARKCGLAIDTGVRNDSYDSWDNGRPQLVAIWSGTVKQLRATGIFLKSYRFPTGARGMQFRFSRERRGRMFSEGRCWMAEVNCGEMPIRLEQHGDIEVIHYAEETAYHGTREVLLAAKICSEKNFPSDKRAIRSGGNFWSSNRCPEWHTRRLHDGTYVYRLENDDIYKKRRAKELQEQEDRSNRRAQPDQHTEQRPDYSTPDKWLEQMEDDICAVAREFLSDKFSSVVTKSGMRYSVNIKHLTEILNSIEVAAQQIRDIPVRVEALAQESTPDAREKATSASVDALFQRFMQTAMVMPQEASGKQPRQ
jgi:hypothetical protein